MAQSHCVIFIKYFKDVVSSRRRYSAMSQTRNHLLTASHLMGRNVNMLQGSQLKLRTCVSHYNYFSSGLEKKGDLLILIEGSDFLKLSKRWLIVQENVCLICFQS